MFPLFLLHAYTVLAGALQAAGWSLWPFSGRRGSGRERTGSASDTAPEAAGSRDGSSCSSSMPILVPHVGAGSIGTTSGTGSTRVQQSPTIGSASSPLDGLSHVTAAAVVTHAGGAVGLARSPPQQLPEALAGVSSSCPDLLRSSTYNSRTITRRKALTPTPEQVG